MSSSFLIFAIGAILAGVIIFLKARSLSGKQVMAMRGTGGIAIAIGLLLLAASAFRAVSPGHVAVATLFGSVRETVFAEGLHFVNPLYEFHEFSVRRQMFDFSGGAERRGRAGGEIVAVSQDSTPLTMDVGFPVRINAPSAWKVFQKIGTPRTVALQLVIPAARASVRDAVANLSWRDAATAERGDLATRIEIRFRELIVNDLISAGFPENEAKSTLTIQPVQLRKILPPQKVLNAVAEKIASEEDLQRQKTLTQIAEEEARRRINEGKGVSNLFSELPTGFSPSQIREVLMAIADKTRAEALVKAVETGQVKVIVLQGSSPAVSIPSDD